MKELGAVSEVTYAMAYNGDENGGVTRGVLSNPTAHAQVEVY